MSIFRAVCATSLFFLFSQVVYVQAAITESLNLPKDTILMQGDVNLLGAQNGDWIQFLESRCGGRSCGRMRQLNPQFGQRVMQALQAAEQQTGTRARINDSFRSVQEQAAAYSRYQNGGGLAAPPGRSYHGRGLAVDVGPAAIYTKLHQISSQYGIFNPPSIRGRDPVHFQMGSCDAACQAQTPPAAQDTSSPGAGNQQQGATSSPQQQNNQQQTEQFPQQQLQNQPQQFGDTQQPPPQQPAEVETEGDVEMSCAPQSIPLGEPVTVSWKCPAASQSRASAKPVLPSFNTKNKISGTLRVSPKAKTTFTITCVKTNKVIASASCTIPVAQVKKVLTVRLSAKPAEVHPGERVELQWSSTNSKSCTLAGPGVASNDVSGRMTTEEITQDVTYTLTCTGIQKNEKITRTATVRFSETVGESDYPADAL